MDHPYHITVFDNFHRHEPEEAWVGGTFATAEEAIAAVKRSIDDELAYLWSEVCHQDKGISTLDRLVSQYNSFAEMPVAFSRDGDMIFDSTAYTISRATEMIDEAPAQYGLQASGPRFSAQQRPASSVPRPLGPLATGAAVAKHRFPRFMAVWASLNKPRPPALLWVALLLLCLLCGLIYRALR
jgi:hypothetical protein